MVCPGFRGVEYPDSDAVAQDALEGGALKVNPRTGVKLPRPEREEMVFLTATQVLELAEAIGAEYRTLVLFAAYTWMRAGEIAALRWDWVDLLRSAADRPTVACGRRGCGYAR